MKIKLLTDIPVAPALGLTAGRIIDAYVPPSPAKNRTAKWFTDVAVADGVTVFVGILLREAEIVPEPEVAPADIDSYYDTGEW